jgi:hypothetical protein
MQNHIFDFERRNLIAGKKSQTSPLFILQPCFGLLSWTIPVSIKSVGQSANSGFPHVGWRQLSNRLIICTSEFPYLLEFTNIISASLPRLPESTERNPSFPLV